MATKPKLQRLSPPPHMYDELSDELKRWLSNIVDQLNTMMQQIEDSLP